MNENVKPGKQQQNRQMFIPQRHPLVAWLGLMGLIFVLTACNYPGPDDTTTEPSFPTETPVGIASIEGIIWHDLCANTSGEEELPPGCVINEITGGLIANGVLETGEPGLPDVNIELGFGPCPSFGLAKMTTDYGGRYSFQGLLPGEYCVSANFGESHLLSSLEPGIWTNPASGMHMLALGSGDVRKDVNFGWDFLNSPARPTQEPAPESTPVPSCLDSVEYIKDVTIPDGTRIDDGDLFAKTWRLRNNGDCTWTRDYDLIFLSGYRMRGSTVKPISGNVEPGQVVDLTVDLKAPSDNGTYWGYWMLRNADGDIFGLGDGANLPFWVKIVVEPEITEWLGEYFDNRKLEGEPDLVRNDEDVDFNWKFKSPSSSLSINNFSARWTRRLKFDAATYRFSIRVDDGVRLWVDNRLVIDEWDDGSVRTTVVDLEMTKGKHDLKVEYFEREGDARIHLNIEKISVQNDARWIATYWYNRTMDSQWALVKTIDEIDFDWGSNSPALGIPKDDFSALWNRVVDFEPGTYRFYARADDGIRVDIDGDRTIDEWYSSNASETYTADVELSGSHSVDVEYFERGGAAKVTFWWEFLEPVNQSPTAASDAYETMANEVLIVPAPGVLGNDEDPDEDTLTVSLSEAPTNGSVTLDVDGSFVYLPDPDFAGEDLFIYMATDGSGKSEPATVTVTVILPNRAPVASDDSFQLEEDQVLEIFAPGVMENDSDKVGQSLTAALVSDVSHGSLILNEDGSFTYTPDLDYNGLDSFTYLVSDGDLSSNSAAVSIDVAPVNDTPLAFDDMGQGEEGDIIEVAVLANDRGMGDDPISVEVETSPENGVVEVIGNLIRYTPTADFVGEDSFAYKATDVDGESSNAIVNISITAPSPANEAGTEA
jgi:VCBS repeat-containing protein